MWAQTQREVYPLVRRPCMLEMSFHAVQPTPSRTQALKPSLPAGVNNLVQAEKLLQIALVLPSATLIGWVRGHGQTDNSTNRGLRLSGSFLGASPEWFT